MRRSKIHGNGVFATAKIESGEDLITYRGRLITHAQADQLYEGLSDTGHTFLFILNDQYVLDANTNGNEARWINHSCDPNCRAVHEEHDKNKKLDRIYVEALRDIKLGEELTYDYGIRLEERQTARLKKIWACHCGSAKCTGTMLKPKR